MYPRRRRHHDNNYFPYPLPERLTPEEERELGRRMRAGDIAARDQLILSNLPAAMVLASRYATNAMTTGDLLQVGEITLIRAAQLWDPDNARGAKFITYAWRCMQQRIANAAIVSPVGAKLPGDAATDLRRFFHEEAYGETTKKPVRRREIVEHLASFVRSQVYSVSPLGIDEQTAYHGKLAQVQNALCIAGDQDSVDSQEIQERLLQDLDPRSALILRLRFGFPPEEQELTLEEIGQRLGLTRERVRQLEKRALLKIRKRLDPTCYGRLPHRQRKDVQAPAA